MLPLFVVLDIPKIPSDPPFARMSPVPVSVLVMYNSPLLTVKSPVTFAAPITSNFEPGVAVPIPNELVEGFHTNKSSVLVVVNPTVTSTKGIYLFVLVVSKETAIEDA